MKPTVIVLTYNSEKTLSATLSRARLVSDEVFVVDSFRADTTLDIAREHGAITVQHAFEHYGAQRNWAIQNLPVTGAFGNLLWPGSAGCFGPPLER